MIPLFSVHVPREVDAPLLETLHSGYVGQGPKVEEFERAFGAFLGGAYLVALNSGTSAITLALRLAGVGPGDEVVTTPMTCSATNLPILAAGAIPVWADVNPDTGLIDTADVKQKATDKTKVVICVDWGGMPSSSTDLWLNSRGAYILQDAAHSLGSYRTYPNVGRIPTGKNADFTCFSLQAIKHITTVDGGVLCIGIDNDIDHHEAYRRARLLRWFGIDRDAPSAGDSRIDVDIEEWGYKFHMNDVTATIGLVQLMHLSKVVAAHRANAAFYDRYLPLVYGRPVEPEGVQSAYWLYTLRLPSKADRDEFRRFMLAKGIQVSQVHRRNDSYTVFKPFANGPLPGVDSFSDRMICIPVHWALTAGERETIVDACASFMRVGV